MLRILANENVPRALDTDAVRAAADQQRLCTAFDRDFGELAAHHPNAATCGIILLRVPSWPVESAALRIAALIDSRPDWAGHFSVIEPGRLWMRPIARTC